MLGFMVLPIDFDKGTKHSEHDEPILYYNVEYTMLTFLSRFILYVPKEKGLVIVRRLYDNK